MYQYRCDSNAALAVDTDDCGSSLVEVDDALHLDASLWEEGASSDTVSCHVNSLGTSKHACTSLKFMW